MNLTVETITVPFKIGEGGERNPWSREKNEPSAQTAPAVESYLALGTMRQKDFLLCNHANSCNNNLMAQQSELLSLLDAIVLMTVILININRKSKPLTCFILCHQPFLQ